MNFFETIAASIYSPKFYASIPKRLLGHSLLYFVLLALIITALKATPIAVRLVSSGSQELNKAVLALGDAYPRGLELAIQQGTVRTNVPEPFFIVLPKTPEERDTAPTNLIVIDTETPFSTQQFARYDTLIWITKDALFAKSQTGRLQTIDLSNMGDVTLNEAFVRMLLSKIAPWLGILPGFLGIFVFIGIFMLLMWRLVYLFFLALLVWFITRLGNIQLTYGQSWKMGLHAMTLGLLVDVFFSWFSIPSFPYWFTLVSLGVVLVNILSVPKGKRLAPTRTKSKKK